MQLTTHVTANLNAHPAAAVAVDAIHVVISVVGAMCLADHGMPGVVEVIPAIAVRPQADKNRPHRASSVGIGASLVRQQCWNAIEMVDQNRIRQNLASKQPQGEKFGKDFAETNRIVNVARRANDLSLWVVIRAVRSLCLFDV